MLAHVQESTDGLGGGVVDEGVHHGLAELVDNGLTLAAVRRGQNVTNLFQQLSDGFLRSDKSSQ